MSKKILIGVTGSISTYKAAELVHKLVLKGHEVKVVMTKGALEFIAPLTFQALSGEPVYQDMFASVSQAGMDHIELARWAEMIVIAPASANFIARLSQGMADDLLTTICLATKVPIYLAPSMNEKMWHHAIVQENIEKLKKHGMTIWGPAIGIQACGDNGAGRMLESQQLLEEINASFVENRSLEGEYIVITAGPTREPIDPVRFISNHASGKMGYALAKVALKRGAKVCLISGPTTLIPPAGVELVLVETADEMYDAVMRHIPDASVFISTAAVADYKPTHCAEKKIKKSDEVQSLALRLNKDILKTVALLEKPPLVVGFAAETDNLIEEAKKKLIQKKLDMIVANEVGKDRGFYADKNEAVILTQSGQIHTLPLMPKEELAAAILTAMRAIKRS